MNASPLILWVVDDDLNEHLLIGHAFKSIPAPNDVRFFQAALAAKGALESAQPNDLPHVILCDLKMPVMDGFELLQWLRSSKWRSMPFALFSNSNIQNDIDRAYAMGANAFHVKSTTQCQLRECVEIIVRFWGHAARVPGLRTEGQPAH